MEIFPVSGQEIDLILYTSLHVPEILPYSVGHFAYTENVFKTKDGLGCHYHRRQACKSYWNLMFFF